MNVDQEYLKKFANRLMGLMNDLNDDETLEYMEASDVKDEFGGDIQEFIEKVTGL